MGQTELIIAAFALGLAALVESLWPRMKSRGKARRWAINLGLAFAWIALVSALWPAIHGAVVPGLNGFTFDLSAFSPSPVVALVGSLLILDFLQYWTHRLIHVVPALWKIHRVHHSDPAVDCTTGMRHHPLEPLLNAPVQFAFVAIIGLPLEGVIAYGLGATAAVVLIHANIRIPTPVDAWARWIVVTPDMHRVHHSIDAADANSNFGMVFPYWDRLFGTYRMSLRDDAVPVFGAS